MGVYHFDTPPFLLDNLNTGFRTKLQAEVFQFIFLNLAAAGHREFLDEEDVLRNLVTGDLAFAEFAHR